jgi:hypothetical protein
MANKNNILDKLSKSKFRSKFNLDSEMNFYVQDKGIDEIKKHARGFVQKRIAPEKISNDGKQTPFESHPVFIAQHATATCCRKCIKKWHKIDMNRELTSKEQDYIVKLIMIWIEKNLN